MFLKFNFTAKYIWGKILWDKSYSHRALIYSLPKNLPNNWLFPIRSKTKEENKKRVHTEELANVVPVEQEHGGVEGLDCNWGDEDQEMYIHSQAPLSLGIAWKNIYQ